MSAPNPNMIILSHATYVGASGATAAATYAFMTKGYKPPSESRYLDKDVVKNQNGQFKYVYDNGPGFRAWSPFQVICENSFTQITGAVAATQYARLRRFWVHPGLLKMQAPDGTYDVHWSGSDLDQAFKVFPHQVGDVIEYDVTIQFEEGTP